MITPLTEQQRKRRQAFQKKATQVRVGQASLRRSVAQNPVVNPNAPSTPPKVSANTSTNRNASTEQGQRAAKEGIFTNPHTGIQTDRYGNVVTGKNKYGVLQTTGTTAPSAMGTASPSTVSPYDIQSPDPSKTLYSQTPSATVPTATTPVVDIGGGATAGTAGVAGTTGAATDSQRLADIAWKQHNGQPLSEEDFKYLVGQQLSGASSLAAQTQAAATAQETAAQTRIDAATAQKDAAQERLSKQTDQLVQSKQDLLDEQARAQIDQIQQNAQNETTAGQNILAFNGFGISSAAVTQAQQIQAKYNAQIDAVNQAKDLEVQMYQAQLQGADQEVLDNMQANIDTMQSNADDMAYNNALDVAKANEDAKLDPLTALANIMQVLPPAQAQQVNTDVSKMLGYLADENGDPITFANGENVPIKTDTEFAKNMGYLQELVDNGASDELINAAMAGLGLSTTDMQNFQYYSQLSEEGKKQYLALQNATKGMQLVQANDGSGMYAFDPTSGTITPLQGQGGVGQLNTGNRRVDANNNPAAFTTDVAKTMGLIEGVDYVQGDKFPGDSNLYTAKLLGDPVETTIRGIDNAGFTTQSGKNRWSYTDSIPGANDRDWPNLSYEEKVRVISEMNKHEGGNGDLTITSAIPQEYQDRLNNANAGESKQVRDANKEALANAAKSGPEAMASAMDEIERKKFLDRTTPIANDFTKATSGYNSVLDQTNKLQSVYNDYVSGGSTSAIGVDQVLISTLNKILDPTSVVRESEYNRTPENLSALNRMQGYYDKLLQGGAGLTDADRKTIMDTTKLLMEGAQKTYDYEIGQAKMKAQAAGIPEDFLLKYLGVQTPKEARVQQQNQLQDWMDLYNNSTMLDEFNSAWGN